MKVLFDYDHATGTITDKNGLVTCMCGMVPFDTEESAGKNNLSDIKELVAAGLTVDEILKLKRENLI